jgi:AraC-like DNA-binding protein
MTDLQISAAAKVSTTTLARITTQSGLVRRAVEQRILAVASPAAGPVISKAPVDPTGTVRRLRALVVAGWPPSALAARSGTDARHLRRVLNESYGFVTLRLEERVRALFANLWNQGPADHGVSPVSVARARKVAVLRGWHPAAVWDDIDNPAEQPNYGEHTPRPDAIVEDVAELVAQGLTREAIAERLGITWDAVQKAHARLSTPLPELAA